MRDGSLFRDERGALSMARATLAGWLALDAVAVLAALAGAKPDNAVWALLSAVTLALVSWAAGPRIAQYLAPQIAGAAQAAGAALRAQVAARRSASDVADAEPSA